MSCPVQNEAPVGARMVDPAAARVRVLEELLRHDLLDVERLQRRANRVVPWRAAEHGVRTQARAHLLFAAGRSGPVSKRAGPQCNAKTANHCGKFEIAKSVLRVGSPLTTSRTPRRRPSSARQDLRDLRRQGSAVRRAEGLRPHAGALGERSARRGDLLHHLATARARERTPAGLRARTSEPPWVFH